LETTHRLFKRLAAGQLNFVMIRVVLHLTEHKAAYPMADDHQNLENPARKPNAKLRESDDNRDAAILHRAPFLQRFVPLIAFVNHPREPSVNRANHVAETHSKPLGKMSKLVRHDTRELPHVQPRHQRDADDQHQVITKETAPSAAKTGGGIDIAIQIDPARTRRADQAADFVDELVNERFVFGIQRVWLRAFGPPGQQRFDHEKKNHAPNKNRAEVKHRA
jgi:hypothetical protein